MAVKKIGQIFVCQKCGNEVIVTRVGGGTLLCCGQEMIKAEDSESELIGEEDEESEE